MNKDQILKRLSALDIVYRESFGLLSGSDNIYFDIKKAFGYPDILNGIANLIGDILIDKESCIAVSGYGGLPLGAVVASKFNRKLVFIRKSEKKHGPKGLIDGYGPTENDTLIILDDVLATGDSIRPVIEYLRGKNLKISRLIVVAEIDKVELPIPHESLFSTNEILSSKS